LFIDFFQISIIEYMTWIKSFRQLNFNYPVFPEVPKNHRGFTNDQRSEFFQAFQITKTFKIITVVRFNFT